MNDHDATSMNQSPSHHRAILRRLGLGLLAALLTVLALGGLAFPGESTGSVIAHFDGDAAPARMAIRVH
jgi:hypothetical protein